MEPPGGTIGKEAQDQVYWTVGVRMLPCFQQKQQVACSGALALLRMLMGTSVCMREDAGRLLRALNSHVYAYIMPHAASCCATPTQTDHLCRTGAVVLHSALPAYTTSPTHWPLEACLPPQAKNPLHRKMLSRGPWSFIPAHGHGLLSPNKCRPEALSAFEKSAKHVCFFPV